MEYGQVFKTARRRSFETCQEIKFDLCKNKENKPINIWGDGSQVRSFIYVDDFLKALEKVVMGETPKTPINIAGKNNYSLKEISETILKLAGKDNKMIIYDKSKPIGVKKRIFDLTNMNKYTGVMEEVSLEDGIKTTIDFFKLHYL